MHAARLKQLAASTVLTFCRTLSALSKIGYMPKDIELRLYLLTKAGKTMV
jgi:hypothetical protein